MEVRYLTPVEYQKWDDFVNISPQGYIWDYSWWLKITTNSQFKICAIFDDDYIIVAGIALTFNQPKSVSPPILTQATGILFEDMTKRNNMRYQKQLTNQKEYTNLILDFIEKDFDSFHLKFHYSYDYWLPFYWRGYKETTRYTYILDFEDYNPAEEFKRFSKGHKWILNRVEKKTNLKVSETNDIEEYLKESDKTYKRQNKTKSYSNEMVRNLFKELHMRNMIKIFKISDSEENTHAIACYLISHNEVYYWLGASDDKYRNIGGHTYLTWFAIQYFSQRVRFFNFGGSMLEPVEKNFRNFSSPFRLYFEISKNKGSQISQLKENKIKNILKRVYYGCKGIARF